MVKNIQFVVNKLQKKGLKFSDDEGLGVSKIDANYDVIDSTLHKVYQGNFSEVKEFLLPDEYSKLLKSYGKESLCEHHAILKLLLSSNLKRNYETEAEELNLAYNYKRNKLFDRMREVGLREEGINEGIEVVKRNQRNLNLMVTNLQLGESIEGKNIPIFHQLLDFSNLMSVKNLDVQAIVDLCGDIFLL